MRRWFGLLAVSAAAAAPAVPPAAAAPAQLDAARYEELLAETRGGLFITSGRTLAGMPAAAVERVVADFIASGPEPAPLQAAALLHTEAAFLPGGGADLHLQLARDLLAALPDPAEREAWLRRWWLAVAHSYQFSLNSVAGVAAYEAALDDLPGDREIRVALAGMLQMVGRQREEQPYLRRASDVLAALLEETPEDAELRVRLAGVALDLGHPDIAAAQLDRVGEARLSAFARLASLLIRGEIALAAERFRDAEAAFSQAVRRARRSPAAVSGLVAARLAQGDRAGAREAAEALLGRRVTGWEPEWRYWLGAAIEFREQFQAMKDEVRAANAGEASR